MSRRLKELMVEELRQKYRGVGSCLVVDIHRAGGEEAAALRRYLSQRGVELRVVPNSLAARALSELGLGEVQRFLAGPCALASLASEAEGEDLLTLARTLLECAREHQVVEVRGGVCQGRVATAQEIEELARLGTRQALLARVVGAFQAPLRRVATVVAAPLGGLAQVLKQAAERGGSTGSPP